MTDSILEMTKKNVGLTPDDESFDVDIIMHINTVFFKLHQLGIGPEEVFEIDSNAETWSQFFNGVKNMNAAKTYMYLNVRLLFDPPATSFTIAAFKEQLEELAWRLTVAKETEKVNT